MKILCLEVLIFGQPFYRQRSWKEIFSDAAEGCEEGWSDLEVGESFIWIESNSNKALVEGEDDIF